MRTFQGAMELLESRRLMAFGDLDASFGESGRAHITTNLAAANQVSLNGVTRFSTGKLGVVSRSYFGLRTVAGGFDSSFSGDGKVSIAANRIGRAVAVSEGKLLVLTSPDSSGGEVQLTRYKLSGAIDTSFGDAGTVVVMTDADVNDSSLMNMRVGVDSSITVFVTKNLNQDSGSFSPEQQSTLVARYDATGQPVNGFGQNGKLTLALPYLNPPAGANQGIGTREQALGMDIASDGSTYLNGLRHFYKSGFDSNGDFSVDILQTRQFLVKLKPDGTLDKTFNSEGYWEETASYDSRNVTATGLLVTSDSKIISSQVIGKAVVRGFDSTGNLIGTMVKPDGMRNKGYREFIELNDGTIVGLDSYGGNAITGTTITRIDRAGNEWKEIAPVTVGGVDRSGNTSTYGIDTALDMVLAADGSLIVAGLGSLNTKLDGGFIASTAFDLVKLKSNDTTATPDRFLAGTSNDISSDSKLGIHVAWYDSATHNLKYRYRDATGRWSATEIIDGNEFAGQYVSIAMNSKDLPGVAYFDGDSGDLIFAEKTSAGSWTSARIDSHGSVGLYPSLQYAYDDRPFISYYQKSLGDLRLAQRSAANPIGPWIIETVDSEGNVGRSGELEINPYTGRFSMAYVRSDGAVRFAERPKKGAGWSLQTIAMTAGGADFVQLGYDVQETPANVNDHDTLIAYYDAGPADLKLARRKVGATNFTVQKLASAGKTGQYAQLAISRSIVRDNRLFWYDARNNQVVAGFDRADDSAAPPQVVYDEAYASNGKFLSVDSAAFGVGTFHLLFRDGDSLRLMDV